MSEDAIDELLALAVDLAGQAAGLLLDGLDGERAELSTKSSETDMVTEIDRASERLIVEGILAARPHDGVLGEEGADRPGTSGVRWLVDPIDGTTNYVYGHPGFSVSIAAEVDGRLAVGVVHDALHGEVFTAAAGQGSFRNGQRCTPRATTDPAQALVATGFGYAADRRERQAQALTTILPAIRDIRRMGSASVDLCWVACGRIDAYFERGLAPWDLAAGTVIAREAGALVSDLDGGEPSDDFVLAARPELHAALVPLLRRAGADRV